MNKIKPFIELNNGKLEINPHEGQAKALNSTARFISMQAGTQGGKTCLEPIWLYNEIQKCGEGDYLVGTATYPLLDLKLLPEFIYFFKTLLNLGDYKGTKHIFEFYDGKTRIIFFSATNPESIESATAKAAVLDEAGQDQFKRGTYEAVLRRLSLSRGRVLFGTTIYNMGWFKQEVYDRWIAGDKDYAVIEFDSIANPSFPREEYERARKTMPSWKFDMFYRGKFSKPAGVIYDCFQPCHIIPRFTIPDNYLVYVGHDFGGVNPAAVFFAQNPATGDYTAFHTYKPADKRGIFQQCNDLKNVVGEQRIMKRVGGNHQEGGWRDAYCAQGWIILEPSLFLSRPRDAVETGIDRVYELIKLNKMFVFSDLHDLIDEFQSYSYELNESYEPIDQIHNKSEYHLMDASRYILSDFTPTTVIRQTIGQVKRYW